MVHALMENRNGLVVDSRVTVAGGTAEREAAVDISENFACFHASPSELTRDTIVQTLLINVADRGCRATAHVAQKEKGSGIDGQTIRHIGYQISLRIRKRVGEGFEWLKTIGSLNKLRHRGWERIDTIFRYQPPLTT